MSGETTDPMDPLELMRDAYARGLEAWSTAMEELVGSEGFAAGSGQLTVGDTTVLTGDALVMAPRA